MTVDEAYAHAAALQEQGRLADADNLCRQILAAQPNHPGALYQLGLVAHKSNHLDAAIDFLRRSLAVYRTPEAWTSLGTVYQDARRLDDAEAAFRAAAELAPHEPIVHINLGSIWWKLKRYPDARRAYEKAIELAPDFAVAWHGLMAVAGDQGDVTTAVAAGKRAAELGISTSRFLADLGIAHHEAGDLPGAITAAERALAIEPNSAVAHYNLAQFLLFSGDFERGWREHEWRWQIPDFPSPQRNFSQPMWDGSADQTKTVLLHAEQGFGDTIMWARYIPLACERAQTIVECQPEVLNLMRTIPGPQRVIPRFADPGRIDFHAPFGSLPLIFKTTPDTIPSRVPYVKSDPQLAAELAQRIAADKNFRVGLTWAGRPTHINDRNRSIALSTLSPLREIPGVSFYSLQKGDRGADAASSPLNLIDLTSGLNNFAIAALIDNLDLVITVDTSVAHLAGALAKPVWVMLSFAPDWRWLASAGEKSPWYPTMRLFRQDAPGNWAGVVARIVSALGDLIARARRAE